MNARVAIFLLAWIGLPPSDAILAQVVNSPRESFPYSQPLELEFTGDEDEIETDRDSFTPATSVVGGGRVVVEAAWSFLDNRAVPETHSLPESIVRWGAIDWLELHLGWNYEVGGAPNSVAGNAGDGDGGDEPFLERESAMLYGLKAALTSQDGWRPQSAVIVQGFTPTSGRETATQVVATYVLGWQSASGWKWDSALRYGTDSAEGDHANLWAPSTVLKIPVGERWAVHGEYFGVFTQGRERAGAIHYFSPGVHYLINPDLEVGIRVGWGLSDEAANFFSNVGLGWRY
ncbi:MAG: transporter [Pirellulaceae bacterium]|nr:transporter [Pirellulaceae bacterium]